MNQGHGWVVPREDGMKARCGGPRICTTCQREAAAVFEAAKLSSSYSKFEQEHDRITKEWADQGMLVRGGWEVMNQLLLPQDASEMQRALMRQAFYMGAQHLFTSILRLVQKGGGEVTPREKSRMSQLASELEAWRSEECGLGEREKGSGNA